jgi:hypothetical protein
MKLLAEAVFLGCVFATAAAQDFPECSKWTLGGYHIGMTKQQAFALHGGKWIKPGAVLRSQPEKDGEAIVEFSTDGTLTDVLTWSKQSAASVKLDLIQRLGPPTIDGMPGFIFREPPTDKVNFIWSRWESPGCDRPIKFEDIQSAAINGTGFDSHHVRLGRLTGTVTPTAKAHK